MAPVTEESAKQEAKRDVSDGRHPHTLPSENYLENEAALFASPLPMIGDRKTTTRVELWVSLVFCPGVYLCVTVSPGMSTMSATPV